VSPQDRFSLVGFELCNFNLADPVSFALLQLVEIVSLIYKPQGIGHLFFVLQLDCLLFLDVVLQVLYLLFRLINRKKLFFFRCYLDLELTFVLRLFFLSILEILLQLVESIYRIRRRILEQHQFVVALVDLLDLFFVFNL